MPDPRPRSRLPRPAPGRHLRFPPPRPAPRRACHPADYLQPASPGARQQYEFPAMRLPLAALGPAAAPLLRFGAMASYIIQYSVMLIRGNGVTLRTQKVIQGGDNGHVGRPCEVSPAPPCPELFCELRGLCRHPYFGQRTCGRSEKTKVIEVAGS